MMIHFRTARDAETGIDAAGFFVRASVDEPSEAGIHDRARTHSAWLYSNIESAFRQTPIAEAGGGAANGEDLCVRRRVVLRLAKVVRGGKDGVAPCDDGADGDLSLALCFLCFRKRKLHVFDICHSLLLFCIIRSAPNACKAGAQKKISSPMIKIAADVV